MKYNQKVVLWIGIICMVLMGLFPPWILEIEAKTYCKYSFILNHPNVSNTGDVWNAIFWPDMSFTIDYKRLVMQWVLVVVVTGGFVVTVGRGKQDG